jgi:hypothetical protein
MEGGRDSLNFPFLLRNNLEKRRGSNLGPEGGCPIVFCSFPHSVQADIGILPYSTPRPLASTFFLADPSPNAAQPASLYTYKPRESQIGVTVKGTVVYKLSITGSVNTTHI